jgi:glycosyltransferase involved in cell wall biosynthesis
MKTEVSIIIAFYNNLDFLKKVLSGFKRQQFQSFELVIADDGSNEEVVRDLNKLIKTESISIQHVWHKDSGWRKTQY